MNLLRLSILTTMEKMSTNVTVNIGAVLVIDMTNTLTALYY